MKSKRNQRKRTQRKRHYKGGVIDFAKIEYAVKHKLPMIALNEFNEPSYNPEK